MIRDQIMQIAQSDPKFSQAIDAMETQVAQMPIMAEDLEKAIKVLEMVVQNPQSYQQVVQAAIADGVLQEGMVPPEFDPVFVVSLLVALYGLQDRLKQRGFARGGLAQATSHLAAQGRGGDTMLAHINPREAEVLRRMSGGGAINPNTGLHEYKGGFMKIIGSILPIALSVFAPGIGTMIGSAFGATGAAASMIGGAVIGGAGSALSGGNILQGAAMGGLGGGLSSAVGSGVNSALGTGLSAANQNILGSGLVGGALGAASGQGFLKGATTGAIGGMAGNAISGLAGTDNSGLSNGIKTGGATFGNALTAGFSPKEAVTMGGLSGLASGLLSNTPQASSQQGLKPSDAIVEGLKVKSSPTNTDFGGLKTNYLNGDISYAPGSGADYSLAPTSAASMNIPSNALAGNMGTISNASSPLSNLGLKDAGAALLLGSALGGAPQPVQQAVQTLSPSQQEYFNRPSVQWDWDKMQKDASSSNQNLSQYMAQNWGNISNGAYNKTPGYAYGGALSQVARMAKGSGSGRADTIDAKLSDGEYVMDAETVAMLGDGSTKEGSRRLDEMREKLRQHKGKAMSKGKFSPNAKSPLAYIKEAA